MEAAEEEEGAEEDHRRRDDLPTGDANNDDDAAADRWDTFDDDATNAIILMTFCVVPPYLNSRVLAGAAGRGCIGPNEL